MKEDIFLILPTQLFKDIKILKDYSKIYLVEEEYYFNSKFHKLKLLLHRASLKYYYDYLKKNNLDVIYFEYNKFNYNTILKKQNVTMYDPIDKEMLKKLKKFNIEYIDTPLFLASREELDNYKNSKKGKKITNVDFYKWQRKRLNILMSNDKPLYNNWSFDKENRNPFDKNYLEDEIDIYENKYILEGKNYITKVFKDAFGDFEEVYYPNNHKDAESHLNKFIKNRLNNFGKYQDSISQKVVFGEHSNISALLNNGLLTPLYVVQTILRHFHNSTSAYKKELINSVEAIIRQIIGWREYIRFVYIYNREDIIKHDPLKNTNSLPKSWYNNKVTTDLKILDHYIGKVYNYGYLHHIERLMVINNLFILYGIKFTDIYKWFMICFIDSYDWVMVPNLKMNMSSLNDKIQFMTKIYIASDNYIKKMSDFKDKEDYEIINKMYWDFIKKNKNVLKKDYSIRSQINRIK